ncbi:MAG: hypothetical protein ACKV2V_22280, partial [Blastocatellia bacterium]
MFPSRHTFCRHALISIVLLSLTAAAMLLWQEAPELRTSASTVASARAGAALPAVPAGGQFAISANLGREDSRYHAARRAGGFRGDNPRQGLQVDFTAKGTEIRSGGLRWHTGLRAMGYGDTLRDAPMATPTAEGNRIAYQRGAVTEWYVNGPLGLQQGFTIASAPDGAGGDAPLTLALAPVTDLHLEVAPDKRGLRVIDQGHGGATLHYTGLLAWDATGRELPAWIETRDGQPLLRVNDTGASYPLTVDPFIQTAKLTASDGYDG